MPVEHDGAPAVAADVRPCAIEPRAPVRPSVPPIAWLAVAQFLGVLLAEDFAWRAYAGAPGWVAAGIVAGVVALGAAWALRGRGAIALAALGLAAGILGGVVYWSAWAADGARLVAGGARARTVDVTGDARSGAYGQTSAGRVGRTEVELAWGRGMPVPAAGERASVVAQPAAVRADDSGRAKHQAGVAASLRVRVVPSRARSPGPRGWVQPVRSWAIARCAAVPGVGGDLLGAVLLGDRRRLNGTPVDEDFKNCGLAHLIAVSGSHLVVISALAVWLLGALGLRPLSRFGAVAALTGAYVLLSGVQTSAVRCWVMALIAGGMIAFGRRSDPLAALAATASVMLALDPSCAFDLGFRLAVCAVAGLALLGRLAHAWTAAALPRRADALARPVSATLVAVAATAPVAAPAFAAVSLIAPVANLLAAPPLAASLALGLAALVSAAVVPPLGDLMLRLDGSLLAAVAGLVTRLAATPHAALAVAWSPAATLLAVAACCALWAWWPVPTRRLARVGLVVALATSLLAISWQPSATAEVRLLDVGQGDAILIRDGTHAMLVDGGPSPTQLRRELARAGVRRLDAVLATHMHADHAAGFRGLDGVVPVARAYVPPGCSAKELAAKMPRGARITVVSQGMDIACGSWDLAVLWPPPTGHDPNQNDGCIVALAQRPGCRVLLTGDAESDVLEACIRAGTLTRIDVLKVGHHGSAGAVSDASLGVLRPQVAVISVGAGNRFGHPKPSTLATLKAAGVPVFRTDLSGDISVQSTGSGFRVILERRARYNARTEPPTRELHGLRAHTGLPALRLRGPPRRPSAAGLSRQVRRGRRPRFQHVDV